MTSRAPRRALLALVGLLPFVARAQQTTPEVAPHPLSGTQAGTILGRDVFDSKGDNVGQLVDVVVDGDGKPLAGVIDVGGFLGVGTRRVAIAWHLLRFVHDSDGTHIVMDLTFDSAAAAPEFEGPDDTLIVIDRSPP
jgi:sporulation protein YlmC with PRC-barrel domain